ncbi:MAG: glycerophosphodiester phosphodiesterase, partial [Actinomycetaceae bacterium]
MLGHRGASAELPENTPAAFRRAVERGAAGVELDTHLSSDSVPVVRHDLRLGDGRAVRELAADELTAGEPGGPGIGLPTLIEALDAVHAAGFSAGTSPWALVEIKSAPDGSAPCASPAEQVAAVGRVLAEHPLGARCVLESFDRSVLAEAARLLPDVPRAVLADAATTAPGSAFLGGPGHSWADPDPVAGALALGAVAVVAEHRWLD